MSAHPEYLRLSSGGRPSDEAIPVVSPADDPLSLFVDREREAATITADALSLLERGPECFLRAPWMALREMIGPIPAGSFVIVAGRSGHGKTTLLLSWFDALTENQFPCMYAGTEMGAKALKIHWACRRLAARGTIVHPGDALTGKLHRDSLERVEGWAEKAAALHAEIARMRGMHEWARLVPVPALNARVITRLAEQAKAWGMNTIFLDHLDQIDADDASRSDVDEHNKILKAIHAASRKFDITFIGAAQLKQASANTPVDKFRPFGEEVVRFGMLKRQISDLMLSTYKPLPTLPLTSSVHSEAYRKAMKRLALDPTGIERFVIRHTMGVGLMKDRAYGHDGRHCYLGVHASRITDAAQMDELDALNALLAFGGGDA